MDGIQLSLFDAVPAVFSTADERNELYEILQRGSGYSGGCLRIYAAFMLLDPERFEDFLPDEFGIGGHSVKCGFVDYGGQGLIIRHWANKGYTLEYDSKYTWKQIANAYRTMIGLGIFPDAKVAEQYEEARKAGKGVPRPRMHYWGGDD